MMTDVVDLEELMEEADGLDELLRLFKSMPDTRKVVNEVKLRKMLRTADKLSAMLPEARIKIEVDAKYNQGSLSANLDDLSVDDTAAFADIIKVSDNFDTYLLTDGCIRLELTFQGVVYSV